MSKDETTIGPIRLWGIGTGRTLRPVWILKELGLPFEHEAIVTRTKSMDRPDFRRLSDRIKVPLLEDGDLMIGESASITLHLADRYRSHGVFVPEPGTPKRSLHDELCWYAMTEIDAILYTIRRHEGLPEIYGASEVAVKAARDYTLRSFEEIERRLSDGRPHLTGDDFTVADLIVKTCLDWATMVCRIPLSESLGAYSARIALRPAYAAAMQQNFPPDVMAQVIGRASS